MHDTHAQVVLVRHACQVETGKSKVGGGRAEKPAPAGTAPFSSGSFSRSAMFTRCTLLVAVMGSLQRGGAAELEGGAQVQRWRQAGLAQPRTRTPRPCTQQAVAILKDGAGSPHASATAAGPRVAGL